MDRDPNISKMIREGGLEKAPLGFTGRVMNLIDAEPKQFRYKPLIGKGGRIIIILLLITFVVLSILLAEPGAALMKSEGLLSGKDWKIPSIHLDLQFLSNLHLSGGIAAALLALFILVLSDAGLRKRRMA